MQLTGLNDEVNEIYTVGRVSGKGWATEDRKVCLQTLDNGNSSKSLKLGKLGPGYVLQTTEGEIEES